MTTAIARDEFLTLIEESETSWAARNSERRSDRSRKAGRIAVLLVSMATAGTVVYGYLTLLADSGVRAMVAVEREYLQPEGVRGSDPSGAIAQFAELGTRHAFVGGDKAEPTGPAESQEPPVTPPFSPEDL